MAIAKSIITQVEERIDMIELVRGYVALTFKGKKWWGCCPFHNEKSASFTVDPERKNYYCFGCKAHGSLFQFYMELEGVTFPEAVAALAMRLGIEVQPQREEDFQEAKQRKALLEMYQKLTGSFEYLLWHSARGEEALHYLTSRKLSEESIKKFRIGYGMMGYSELYQFLIKRGYSDAFLSSSGLFSSKKRQYSLFRDRILFPLVNATGQVVAYSGRAMADAATDAPKYINSPDTIIFSKRQELFGMYQAKETIRKEGFILCEGAMDAVALHQMGYTGAVAPLGSAISLEQIELLKRFHHKGLLLMDGDEAGQKAIRSAAILCEKASISTKAVRLHAQKDPSDCLQFDQVDLLTKSIENATLYFDFLLQEALRGVAKDNIDQQLSASEPVFAYINAVSSPARQETYLKMLAAKLQLSSESMLLEYQRFDANVRNYSLQASPYEVESQIKALSLDKDAVVELLCATLMQPRLYELYRNRWELIDFKLLDLEDVHEYLLHTPTTQISMDHLLEHARISPSLGDLFQQKRLSSTNVDEEWSERAQKAMSRIEIHEYQKQRSTMLIALAEVSKNHLDMVIVSEIQREIYDINNELQGVQGGGYGRA
jgi:DNA primase